MAREPSRNFAIVLVSGVHNATLQAIEYAETLSSSDIRALSFGLDSEESERLGEQWFEAQIPVPLEMEACPFRDIGPALVQYLRETARRRSEQRRHRDNPRIRRRESPAPIPSRPDRRC